MEMIKCKFSQDSDDPLQEHPTPTTKKKKDFQSFQCRSKRDFFFMSNIILYFSFPWNVETFQQNDAKQALQNV